MRYFSKFLTLLFSLTLFPIVASSQGLSISGQVIEQHTHTPIVRAQIKIRKITGTQILTFAQTDKDGHFKIEKNLNGDSLVLEVSCIGYATQQKMLSAVSNPLVIEMEQKETQLKEVVVRPTKIRLQGDTVRYLVSAFAATNDRTIGDVLKKMPGIEVLESGEIKYQGKSLNKFYIEGSDLLGGRYGLATNNVSHKDVASVEIMENHQPVKAVEDIVFSDQPALNIKLKEDAKSRWAGTLKLGGGIPELWEVESFAMRFKPKTQSFNTYKGNNVRNNYYETMTFAPSGDFSSNAGTGLPEYIQVSPSIARGIGSNRSGFIESNNLTSNNLFKVGKDLDLITEIIGSIDRQTSEFASQTSYFLDNNRILTEDKLEEAESLKKNLEGKFRLKSNQKKFYFNNNLQFLYDRNDPTIDISGTYSNKQRANTENKRISNDFDILQRMGDKFFTFRSMTEYASKPQTLNIYRDGESDIRQKVDLSSFYTNNSIDYSFFIGKIRLGTKTRLLFQNRKTDNALMSNYHVASSDDAISCYQTTSDHDINVKKLKADFVPSANYDLNDWHFSIQTPIFYQQLSLDKESHTTTGINPSFSMDWIASSMLKLRASAGTAKNLPDESLYYYGDIMNDYRNLTTGYIDFSTGRSTFYSTGVDYKDVVALFFANLNLSYSQNKRTRISEQNFQDEYIYHFYSPGETETNTLAVSGSISKGIGKINGTFSLFPVYTHNKSSIVRNGTTIPYQSDIYSIRGTINSRPINWCDLNYIASYSYNQYRMNENTQYATSNRLSESLKASFYFLKSLQLSYVLEHYCNELSPGNYKNFVFSDITASYLIGNRWEMACAIRNIFDEKQYSYFAENELITIHQNYKIRPRNILTSATYRF